MDALLRIAIVILVVLVLFGILAYWFMQSGVNRIIRKYGANRKPSKENVVKTILIDRVDDND